MKSLLLVLLTAYALAPMLLACSSDEKTSSSDTDAGNNTAAPAQVTDAPAQATQEANKAAATGGRRGARTRARLPERDNRPLHV